MTHTEVHKLERRIAEVLSKGFCHASRPDGRGFDQSDALLASHDVAEMLLSAYWMEDKAERAAKDEKAADESFQDAVQTLKKAVSCPESCLDALFHPPSVIAAGFGGGDGCLDDALEGRR